MTGSAELAQEVAVAEAMLLFDKMMQILLMVVGNEAFYHPENFKKVLPVVCPIKQSL